MEKGKIFLPGNLKPPYGFIPVPAYFENRRWRLGSDGMWAGSQVLGLALIFIATVVTNGHLLENGRWLTHLPIRFLVTALPALGFLIVFVNGGLDLSMGSVGALSAAVAATSMAAGMPPVVAVMLALVLSLFFGLINGALVGAARVPGLLVTLVTGILVRGLSNAVMQGMTIGIDDKLSGMPVVGWGMLLLLAVGAFLWIQLPAWNGKAAPGVSRVREAFQAGLPYVISALCAGVYGLVFANRLNAATPIMGETLLFESLTIMVLAGVCWYARYGNVVGVLLGCMAVTLLNFLMSILDVNFFVQNVIIGILCLLGMGWMYLYHWIVGLIHRGAGQTTGTPATPAADAST